MAQRFKCFEFSDGSLVQLDAIVWVSKIMPGQANNFGFTLAISRDVVIRMDYDTPEAARADHLRLRTFWILCLDGVDNRPATPPPAGVVKAAPKLVLMDAPKAAKPKKKSVKR